MRPFISSQNSYIQMILSSSKSKNNEVKKHDNDVM